MIDMGDNRKISDVCAVHEDGLTPSIIALARKTKIHRGDAAERRGAQEKPKRNRNPFSAFVPAFVLPAPLGFPLIANCHLLSAVFQSFPVRWNDAHSIDVAVNGFLLLSGCGPGHAVERSHGICSGAVAGDCPGACAPD